MMRRWMWFFLGVLLSAGPMLAFADSYPPQHVWTHNATSMTQGTSTWAQVIAAYGSGNSSFVLCTNPPEPVYPITQTTGYARYTFEATCPGTNVPINYSVSWGLACPYGGTLSTDQTQCFNAPACATGQTRDVTTGQCIVPPCQAGVAGKMSLHVGWDRTLDYGSGDIFGMHQPAIGCTGTNNCAATPDLQSPSNCRVVASSGPPYPVFCDYNVTTTGSVCTSSQQAQSQSSTNPPPVPCPTGYQTGYVNNVAGCYKVDTTSSTQNTVRNADGSTVKTTTVTDPDQSKTTITETCDAAGNCSTSRTKTAASAPGPGTGSTPEGDQLLKDMCTKQPEFCKKSDLCKDNPKSVMCQEKAKIDPEDMKTTADFSNEQTNLGAAMDQGKDYLQGGSWKVTNLGFVWNPSIPSGACSAYTIFGKSFDICPAMEKARMLWSWVIGVIASLAIWVMGTRTAGGLKP